MAAVAELPGLEAVLVNCCCPQASTGCPNYLLLACKTVPSCLPGPLLAGHQAFSQPTGGRSVAPLKQSTPAHVQAAAAALPVLSAAAPPHVRVGCYANGFSTTTSGEWPRLVGGTHWGGFWDPKLDSFRTDAHPG